MGDARALKKRECLHWDSILILERIFPAASGPWPSPWAESQEKAEREDPNLQSYNASWSIQVQQKQQITTTVIQDANRSPETPLAPVKGGSQVLRAGQVTAHISFHGGFVPGQCERDPARPEPRGLQNAQNRWNYVSVRDLRSVYSLARFIYQVRDWKDFPTGYGEISLRWKCFFNKRLHWSGLGFRILAEERLLPFAGISGKNKYPHWQTKQAEVWTSIHHSEEQLSLFTSPPAYFNLPLD